MSERLSHYNVHYTYFVGGVNKAKGHAVVLAETVEQAEEVFRSEHPNAAGREFRLIKIIANPLNFA